MTVTNFFWDELSDNLLMETDENNVPTVVYTHRPERFGELISQKRGGVTSYYHYDGEHSTRLLTDDNQTITDTYIFSAYGELVARTGTTTNPFGYKGAVGYYTNSATSDIYVRARTYQPVTGRWLSKDPLGFVDGPNLYRAYFVPGGIDPSGKRRVCCKFRRGWAVSEVFYREIQCSCDKKAFECCEDSTNLWNWYAVEDATEGLCGAKVCRALAPVIGPVVTVAVENPQISGPAVCRVHPVLLTLACVAVVGTTVITSCDMERPPEYCCNYTCDSSTYEHEIPGVGGCKPTIEIPSGHPGIFHFCELNRVYPAPCIGW